jgi:hypothetical protein
MAIWDGTRMIRPETSAENLFFVTARLLCEKADESWSGTGFFVHVPAGNAGARVVLVTNRHVLAPADLGAAGTVRVVTPAAAPGDPTRPLFGQRATAVTHNPVFVTHVNDNVDVAVMGMDGLSMRGPYEPFYRSLPLSMFENEKALAELDAIELVTFIGYPNSLHDRVNMTPIARRGWTATPISLDYGGRPAFLIDASVFPGSSGSPVFVVNNGSHVDRQGRTVFSGDWVVPLGIVAAVHLHTATGEIIQAIDSPRVAVRQTMNLGVVYKTRTITEAINRFLTM